MVISTRPVGRINFVLRTLLLTAMAFAFENLGDGLLRLHLLSRYSYTLQRVILFGLIGKFLATVIDGRLIDAGLPRYLKYPVAAFWLMSTSMTTVWPSEWPIGVALFILLLVAGCSIPGKVVLTAHTFADPTEGSSEFALSKNLRANFPPGLVARPRQFLRRVLTVACLWLPLIWLQEASNQGACLWVARSGYAVLTLVLFFNVLGRLADAGRLPRKRYGFLSIVLLAVLSPRALHSSHIMPIGSALMTWAKYLNSYEIFGLLVLVLVALACLPSKTGPTERGPGNRNSTRRLEQRAPTVERNILALCGPLQYLRILAVIACFCISFIYMDKASDGSVGTWIARAGDVILALFWLIFANGRLEDAGWAHDWYPSQFVLVVCIGSLMPLATHWVNPYEAVIIFVLIQTPIALLRTKPMSDELALIASPAQT